MTRTRVKITHAVNHTGKTIARADATVIAVSRTIRFAVDGHPVRKFALITESGRNAAELCQALHSRGDDISSRRGDAPMLYR